MKYHIQHTGYPFSLAHFAGLAQQTVCDMEVPRCVIWHDGVMFPVAVSPVWDCELLESQNYK